MSRRHTLRAGMWACLVCSLILGALLTLSLAHSTWLSGTRTVGGVTAGRIEIGHSSGKLSRQSIAWGLQNPGGYSSILTAPGSVWRPSTAQASMTMSFGSGGPPATTQTLWVLYIPLWPWLTIASASTLALWRLAGRRVLPGHCPRCNYDLRGLTTGRCPECGTPTASLAKRLIAFLAPRRSPRLT